VIAPPGPLPVTVVGVVSDARFMGLDRAPTGEVYVPDGAIDPMPLFTLFVRTTGRASAVLPELARQVRADSRFRLARARTVDAAVVGSIRPRLLRAWLFGGFGVAAAAILGTGILALVASVTARRFREIGIRIAVGATRDRIVRLFAREQIKTIGGGLIVGAFVAAWIAPLTQPLLYEVGPYDWRGWSTAAGVIIVTAAIGVLVPLFRATARDPVDVLRTD
jgi:hypothetical protein